MTVDHTTQTFGTLLRLHRRRRELTQDALGEAAGFSGDYIKRLEAGSRRATADTAALLARALELDPDRAQELINARGRRDEGTETADSAILPAPSTTYRLPAPATPFIGRDQEVRDVTSLLQEASVRLLTLTGPGGVGKTRLALQVGAQMTASFPDGACFVPLAAVSDAEGVLPAIAAPLDVREAGGRPLAEVLVSFLKRKRMLLILDNFEQVVDAAPHIGALLSECLELVMLVTSRTLLQLYGECQYVVPSLAVPDTRALPALDKVSQYDSVALFIQRARAIKRDFSVTNDNAPAVAEICVRLDGLPLAIELAAARIAMLPPKAILDRLGSRLTLLTGGARDMPQRHRTLRSAIEWSYDLLDEGEQALFRRLGVYVGGWTLEAAEAVCNADGDIDVFEGLGSLVQKSLVRQVEGVGDEPRFDMLETIREYALEQLQRTGESATGARSHAEYWLAVAEEAAPHLVGPDQVAWLDRLEQDHDNLRVALGWWLDRGDGEAAARFALALDELWVRRGHLGEGREWLQNVLALHSLSNAMRPRILDRLGWLVLRHGRSSEADPALIKSLELARETGDEATMATALCGLGHMHIGRDLDSAAALANESLIIHRKLGDKRNIAIALDALSRIEFFRGNIDRCFELAGQGVALSRECGDTNLVASALDCLAWVEVDKGEYERASPILRECVQLSRDARDKYRTARALMGLGWAAMEFEDCDTAAVAVREALLMSRELGHVIGIEFCLNRLGTVAAVQDRPARAALLWSAVSASKERAGEPLKFLRDRYRERHERDVARARQALGEAAWTQSCEEGRAISLDQAVALALEEESPESSSCY